MLIGVGERVAVLAPDRARAAARAAAGPLQGAPAGRDAHEPGPGALQGQRAGFDLGFVRREGDVLLAAVVRLVVGVVRGGGRERAARGARDGALVGLERVRERVRAVHARDELSGVALRLPGEEHAPGVRVLERPRRRRRRHGASTARDSFGEIRGSEPRGAARRGAPRAPGRGRSRGRGAKPKARARVRAERRRDATEGVGREGAPGRFSLGSREFQRSSDEQFVEKLERCVVCSTVGESRVVAGACTCLFQVSASCHEPNSVGRARPLGATEADADGAAGGGSRAGRPRHTRRLVTPARPVFTRGFRRTAL